jgi:large subunit ribosomal protein L3
MGGERTTVLNLDVVKIDGERDILMLRGAIPGPKGAVVLVREAVKTNG